MGSAAARDGARQDPSDGCLGRGEVDVDRGGGAGGWRNGGRVTQGATIFIIITVTILASWIGGVLILDQERYVHVLRPFPLPSSFSLGRRLHPLAPRCRLPKGGRKGESGAGLRAS